MDEAVYTEIFAHHDQVMTAEARNRDDGWELAIRDGDGQVLRLAARPRPHGRGCGPDDADGAADDGQHGPQRPPAAGRQRAVGTGAGLDFRAVHAGPARIPELTGT